MTGESRGTSCSAKLWQRQQDALGAAFTALAEDEEWRRLLDNTGGAEHVHQVRVPAKRLIQPGDHEGEGRGAG